MCISSHVFIIDMYGIAGCFQVLLCRIQNVSDYQGRGERRVLDAVRISLEEIPEIVIFMGKIWEHMGTGDLSMRRGSLMSDPGRKTPGVRFLE